VILEPEHRRHPARLRGRGRAACRASSTPPATTPPASGRARTRCA
jgi:hypothetical protein